MAVLTVEGRRTDDADEIRGFLERYGIWYRRSDVSTLPREATADEVLAAYEPAIERLKNEGGYTTADVIDITPEIPGLPAMLAKFSREHTHDEDEVRFIVEGRGVFHVNPGDDPVFRLEVAAGDMINVPRGTRHWFDLCAESRIRAVRLFQDASGWTPHYTDSGEETQHEPLCFGPSYLPPHLAGG